MKSCSARFGSFACIAGVLTLSAGLIALPALALEPGATVPTFSLPDGRGGQVTLEQYRGKLVYVDFWASWCGPCRQSFPWMNDLQARYGDKGLHIVAINVDAKPEDAKRFLTETPGRFQIAYDPKGTTPRAYQVKGMPSSYVVGRDGSLIEVHSGFSPTKAAEIEARLKRLLETR